MKAARSNSNLGVLMKRLLLNQDILAAKNKKNKRDSRDITKNMIRCKSSNMWAYAFDIDEGSDVGTLYLQFKNEHGGAGDIYRYYDVPLRLFNKFVGAPSKGHSFWLLFRNNFQYTKLTGDKRGKLKNAVNY